MMDKDQFVALTGRLVNGLLREAIGYSVEREIPYYRAIAGFMVEAPMLWIRHSRFPILTIAYDQKRPDVLADVLKQLEMAKTTEYFALLIVVPTRDGTVNEAEELRHVISNSVYRHDFVVLDREHLSSIIVKGSSQRLVEIILEQGIELSSLSPYVLSGPVPGKMFFGREKEVKTISQKVQTGDYAVVGGRRIGKSSILMNLLRLLNSDPRYQAHYMNCEDKFDYEDFIQALGDDFDLPVDGADPRVFRRLVTDLKKRPASRQMIFLLDEVDGLLDYDSRCQPAGALFKTFRALSHEGVCRFVFSGSRTLFKHLRDPQSPFFNFCTYMMLKPLEEKSVAEMVRMPMRQLGIELPEEDALIQRMVEITSCHPNLTQWLCDRLLTQIQDHRLCVRDLDEVAGSFDFREHFVQTAWGEAAALEKLISLIMEGPRFETLELLHRLGQYGIQAKDLIRQSLDMLQLGALLEREGESYHFALSTFPAMVRRLEDVSLQIDELLERARS